ncbi:polysaccharide biosynthesis protein [Flaviaesturariibacter aridisoli]|uniref:Polysaccharide biosynthesis protein n=2 Tax=Flaviaesturariibacter aridisoli TaxID=2545761 RepID=A0A4R4DTT1_9BACT|nr:polysaccharide biosynthesis protein [Flaviaesturariibacter aridisoli]
MWYGVSSIAARFLNYLLTPYLTRTLTKTASYGIVGTFYSALSFFNIIFTYGLETAYFRFAKGKEEHERVYSTASISLLCSTLLFSALLVWFRQPMATLLRFPDHPEFMIYGAAIIGLDAISTLAFARLRYEGRPRKYALVRLLGIVVNIVATVFFISICPKLAAKDPNSFIGVYYDPNYQVGYLIIANLLQSAVSFLLLLRSIFGFRWRFDGKLWREIILYSAPLILAGFAGMVNETFDRIMLGWWSSAPTLEAKQGEVGIYNACYKLSILITLFIQAFRMSAEPFFFKQAQGQDPKRIYARVMKFFVLIICFMFLVVALFLDVWKYFIGQKYWAGLGVVPVLLLANMFLGVYYNLSIWYKLSNKTAAGAWITLIGAALTLVVNYLFIPRFGYYACAWATFLCYGSMMVVSYRWGQQHYRVPYPTKKLLAYFVITVALYGLQSAFNWIGLPAWANWIFGAALLALFSVFIATVERKELAKLPFVGRFFAREPARNPL